MEGIFSSPMLTPFNLVSIPILHIPTGHLTADGLICTLRQLSSESEYIAYAVHSSQFIEERKDESFVSKGTTIKVPWLKLGLVFPSNRYHLELGGNKKVQEQWPRL